MRVRGRAKAARLSPHVPPGTATLLDLGGAEGYVARALQQRFGMAVTVADVTPYPSSVPFVLLDGTELPFEDAAFDVTVLAYVLHHAAKAEDLLAEACRVTRCRVLILESVYRSGFDHATLRLFDRLANRIRSSGLSKGSETHLNHRTFEGWHETLEGFGRVTSASAFGRWPHHQALFVLDRFERPPGSTC